MYEVEAENKPKKLRQRRLTRFMQSSSTEKQEGILQLFFRDTQMSSDVN